MSWTHLTSGTPLLRQPAIERDRGRQLVLVGGALLAASPFLPWLKMVLIGNVNLFSLASASNSSTGVAYVPIIFGIGVVVIALVSPAATLRVLAPITGILAAVGSVALLVKLGRAVDHSLGFAQLSWGPYAALGGSIAVFIGGLLVTERMDS